MYDKITVSTMKADGATSADLNDRHCSPISIQIMVQLVKLEVRERALHL